MNSEIVKTEPNKVARRARDWSEPEFRRHLGVLRRRIWVVVATVVIVVTLGVVHAFKATPIYEASARILIEKQTPRVMNFEDVIQLPVGDQDYYKTQRELATTRAVLEKAIERPGVRELLEGGAPRAGGGLSSFVGEVKRTVLAVLGTAPTDPPELWEKLRSKVDVEQVRGTHLLAVKVAGANPAGVAKLANAVAGAFEQFHIERKLEGSNDAFRFLEEQKGKQEQKLFQAEDALQRFREEAKVVSLNLADKQNPVLVRLSRLNEQLTETQLERLDLAAHVKLFQRATRPGGEGPEGRAEDLFSFPQVRADPLIADLRALLLTAEKEAIVLADTYGPEHPQFRTAQAEADLLQQRLREAIAYSVESVSAQVNLLTEQEHQLHRQYQEQNELALQLARDSTKYTRLQDGVARQRKLFDVLVERMREVDLTADYGKTNVTVIEAAEVPRLPVKPRKSRMVFFSVVLGLFLGVGLAFLFECMDDTIKTPEDLEERVGIPVLGFVPRMNGAAKSDDSFAFRGLISVNEPNCSVTEAYRNVRTSLFFSAPADDTKVIVVTSGSPGDGKTTTASNLAVVVAQSGKRVLLVDGDFRRPMVHRLCGITDEVGLSTVLVGEATLEEAVQAVVNDGNAVENLDVLAAGPKPPNPAELLGSPAMKRFLERAREKYDKIVIDTPPVLFVADASILGAMSDGVIMVVKSAKNTRSLTRRTAQHLERVNARILGGVLNDVRIASLGYYYSDYYHYGYSRYHADYYGSYASADQQQG